MWYVALKRRAVGTTRRYNQPYTLQGNIFTHELCIFTRILLEFCGLICRNRFYETYKVNAHAELEPSIKGHQYRSKGAVDQDQRSQPCYNCARSK
jgi:hypothetical protein